MKKDKKSSDCSRQLTSEEWGKIYNSANVDAIVNDIRAGRYSDQTKEMIKCTKEHEKILEIGCGSGATTVTLCEKGRIGTALDFSEESLECVSRVAKILGHSIKTIYADATKELPFTKDEFDVIFQAGLLEHFEKKERIELLKLWGVAGKKMISIIPNAASIAYRSGKAIMENNGKWEYGIEMPQYSLREEFNEAGFLVTDEYTIGAEHALNFLPKKHYLRRAMEKWLKEDICKDNCGQGYLLVTIGIKNIQE